MENSFIFYRSFYKAIKQLDNDTLAETVKAICAYALDDEKPELDGVASIVFDLVQPQLDANNNRRFNGSKGGRPKKETDGFKKEKPMVLGNETDGYAGEKPNQNQNVNDNENLNQNLNDNANQNPNAEEKTSKKKPDLNGMIDSSDFSEPLKQAVSEWLTYKTQKRERYTEMGFQKLLTQIGKSALEYGDEAVIDLINLCMMQGYKGIIFDKLKHPPRSGTTEDYLKGWEDI